MRTLSLLHLGLLLGLGGTSSLAAEDSLPFRDNFTGRLGAGWTWVREHKAAWRTRDQGLEVRVEPGNMWGSQNNAQNVLTRLVPDTGKDGLRISVTVSNRPTSQYEQVDLVWYYDDSNMVKLGQELVDGKLSIVMGREEKDKTRTIAIVPLQADTVRLRLVTPRVTIHGELRPDDSGTWSPVGECDIPTPAAGRPKISLQFYQGPANEEHWALVRDFVLEKVPAAVAEPLKR